MDLYVLDIPNEEVRSAFIPLLASITNQKRFQSNGISKTINDLETNYPLLSEQLRSARIQAQEDEQQNREAPQR